MRTIPLKTCEHAKINPESLSNTGTDLSLQSPGTDEYKDFSWYANERRDEMEDLREIIPQRR